MIAAFLFLCVACVGGLGLAAGILELKRHIVSRRHVQARRSRTVPSPSLTSVIEKLEQSTGFERV